MQKHITNGHDTVFQLNKFFDQLNFIIKPQMDYQQQRRLLREYGQQIASFLLRVLKFMKQHLIWVLLALLFALIGYSYHRNFPDHLRHLQPAQWKSHQALALDEYVKNIVDFTPRIFNDTLISICQDLDIDSQQNLYCINQNRSIIVRNLQSSVSQKLFTLEKGNSYGLRLSTDQKYLYFVNSEMGLCQFDIKKRRVKSLVSEYQGEFLISLNGVEVHPQNPDLIYFTQSSRYVHMERFSIDIFLGNAFGRVFEYNKQKQRLSLLADELYFPNGIVFEKYKKQDTLLVAQTSRFRVSRIYLEDGKKGDKQVAIDELDIYPDNMNFNEEGQLLIGAMGVKYPTVRTLRESRWVRLIYSRLPTKDYSDYVGTYQFGGIRVKMNNKNKKHKIEYLLWHQFQNYEIVSTILQTKGTLFISSFLNRGVIVIEDFKHKFKKTSKSQKKQKKQKRQKSVLLANASGYYDGINRRMTKLENAWKKIQDLFNIDNEN